MTAPTVAVTVNLSSMGGPAVAGVTVRARLSANEVYNGFVVASKPIVAVTDASGVAVLNCFPNAPAPTGLGERGSRYIFTIAIPGSRAINVKVQIPNRAVALHTLIGAAVIPPLDAAQAAIVQAQTAAGAAAASYLQTKSLLPAPSAGQLVGWNSSGTALRNVNPQDFDTIGTTEAVLADSGSIVWNLDAGTDARLQLAALGVDRTMNNPANIRRGKGMLIIDQPALGGQEIKVWGDKWRFPDGSVPALSTAGGARDVITYWSDGVYMYVPTTVMGAGVAGRGTVNPTAPIPTPAPAPQAPVVKPVPTAKTLEAEQLELTGTLRVETTVPGFTGTGYVAFFDNDADEGLFRFPAVVASTYDIPIGYRRDNTASVNWVSVNGEPEAQVSFPATAGWGTLTLTNRALHDGTNTLRIRKKDGFLLLDKAGIVPVAAPAPTPAPTSAPAPVPSITGGTGYPFGSRQQAIPQSHIKPTNASAAQMDETIKRCYDRWKENAVRTADQIVAGGYIVRFKPESLYCSEGIGMGALIVVAMAGYDANARTIFDGLMKVARARHAFAITDPEFGFSNPLGIYLMNWRTGPNGEPRWNDGGGEWAAHDGDLDRAYALLMAHKQWGSAGEINYLQEARNVIAAMKSWFHYPDGRLQTRPIENMFRTSDVMLGHFEAFYRATGDSFWLTAKEINLQKLEAFVAAYSPTRAIIPDQLRNTHLATPDSNQGYPDNLDYVDTSHLMYANAQRNPWRLGTAYLYETDAGIRARLKSLCDKWTDFIKADTQGYPERTATGYHPDGSLTSPRNVLFRPYTAGWQPCGMIGPQLCAAMVDASHQQYLNALWAFNRDYFKPSYFDAELQLLPMIVAAGNWWEPA